MTKQQLKEYCEAEFENIDIVLSEFYTVINTEKSGYSVSELAALATFIHNFYNGIENTLKRILLFKQIEIKNTSTWHKDLLKNSSDIGIITEELYITLSNYLSFRHFFVHSYSFSLTWQELRPLAESVESTLKIFRSLINQYIEDS
ncbi:MAG: hypothetical protein KJ607_12240 [Bacteroidetes bacterium]|nr:hypothetical protein [Bacteroidota bacterium]